MQSTPNTPEDALRLLSPSHKQCAWCGVRMDGPLAGYKAIDADGHVQLLVGYSHGLCELCREDWLASREAATQDA